MGSANKVTRALLAGLCWGAATTASAADIAGLPASHDAEAMRRWIALTGDNAGQPFAIVDKKEAKLFVFEADGHVAGAAPALLGQAIGDDSAPGVGDKPVAEVLPQERTTPAGRFASEPGRNLTGEDVVWVDYDSGFAIHRLRPGASYAPRLKHLTSPRAKDHRMSFGCVVVSASFYDSVVRPLLGQRRALVYVLPETRSLSSQFGEMQLALGDTSR